MHNYSHYTENDLLKTTVNSEHKCAYFHSRIKSSITSLIETAHKENVCNYLDRTTSTHTDLISSSLSDDVVVSATASIIGDEEFIRAPQSDKGLRNFVYDFKRVCRAWQQSCFLFVRTRWRELSVWLSEVLCRWSVWSSSTQSDCNRSRKPHREWRPLLESEGSDENFLNSELDRGCTSAVGLKSMLRK